MISRKTNTTTPTADIEADVAKAAKAKTPKRTRKPATKAKTAKASTRRKAPVSGTRGGGKALSDFTNAAKIKVLKRDFPRVECFRTGQTVEQNLAAQKQKGYRGRRKYIRKQVAMQRISLS